MKTYIYALRDKKLGAYLEPVFKRDDQEHVIEMSSRGLRKLRDPGQIVEARDQALYYFGQFDDLKGTFELLETPEKLLDYEDYIPKKEV